jgi:hypothetical protein
MAIFSFRPPASGRRRNGPTPPPEWDVTRPSVFDDPTMDTPDTDFAPSGFEPVSAFADSGFSPLRAEAGATSPSLPPSATRAARRAALNAAAQALAAQAASAADVPVPAAPDPGFAKNLTARPHNDEPLGAGWYISSWDLLQGCDVIEGAPVDILPTEWQRKQPRP